MQHSGSAAAWHLLRLLILLRLRGSSVHVQRELRVRLRLVAFASEKASLLHGQQASASNTRGAIEIGIAR
tara:strand:+ start:349 stop:558 length:210 start_codon:yes stop_codon:yes gene_type:complete